MLCLNGIRKGTRLLSKQYAGWVIVCEVAEYKSSVHRDIISRDIKSRLTKINPLGFKSFSKSTGNSKNS